MAAGSIGIITRVSGPVVDIQFPEQGDIPDIFHAAEVSVGGDTHVLECLQQLGGGAVRCISMRPTDGMSRGMEARDTGAPISVPASEKMLGSLAIPLIGRAPLRRRNAGRSITERRSLRRSCPQARCWRPGSRSSTS